MNKDQNNNKQVSQVSTTQWEASRSETETVRLRRLVKRRLLCTYYLDPIHRRTADLVLADDAFHRTMEQLPEEGRSQIRGRRIKLRRREDEMQDMRKERLTDEQMRNEREGEWRKAKRLSHRQNATAAERADRCQPTRPNDVFANTMLSTTIMTTANFTTSCREPSDDPTQRGKLLLLPQQSQRLPAANGLDTHECERCLLENDSHSRHIQRLFKTTASLLESIARGLRRQLNDPPSLYWPSVFSCSTATLLSRQLTTYLFLLLFIILLGATYGAPSSLDRPFEHLPPDHHGDHHASASGEHNRIPDGHPHLTSEQEYLLGEADDGDPLPYYPEHVRPTSLSAIAHLPKPAADGPSTGLSSASILSYNQQQRQPMSVVDGFVPYKVENGTLNRDAALAAFNMLKPSNTRPVDPLKQNMHPVAIFEKAEEGRRRNNVDKPKKHRKPGERRRPLLGRNQVLLSISDPKSQALKQKCHGYKFKQRVKVEGCLTKIIANRYCHGVCSSFFIPQMYPKKLKAAFSSCSLCSPIEYDTVDVTLDCPGQNPPQITKSIMKVKKCACMNNCANFAASP